MDRVTHALAGASFNISGGTGGRGGGETGETGGEGGIGDGPTITGSFNTNYYQSGPGNAQPLRPHHGCPPPAETFIGRADTLTQLKEFFGDTSQDGQKKVLLHGLGGIGKTQIALKFIADSGSRFTDQFKIDASSANTIDIGYKEIARIKNQEVSSQVARTWLVNNPDEWLILFDNADDVKLNLGNYFPHCNHGNILITSRNPELQAHTGDRAIAISNLPIQEAISLICHATHITDEMIANELAQELECFPLALAQAAAFISQSRKLKEDPSKYLELYKNNKQKYWSERPTQTVWDYSATVYTTWKVSFDRLPSVAQELMQAFSVMDNSQITEAIFKNASEYIPEEQDKEEDKEEDTKEEEESFSRAQQLLKHFLNKDNKWDEFQFEDTMTSIEAYSLISHRADGYYMHPLVHDWTRLTLSQLSNYSDMVLNLLGMSAISSSEEGDHRILARHLQKVVERPAQIPKIFQRRIQKIYNHTGYLQEAKMLGRFILHQETQATYPDVVGLVTAKVGLAQTHMRMRNYIEAQALQQQLVEHYTMEFGSDDELTLRAKNWLVQSWYELSMYTEAQKLQEEALEQQTKSLGPEHIDTVTGMEWLAKLHIGLGNYEEAQELLKPVVNQYIKLLGHDDFTTIIAQHCLLVSLQELGRNTEGQELELQWSKERMKNKSNTNLIFE